MIKRRSQEQAQIRLEAESKVRGKALELGFLLNHTKDVIRAFPRDKRIDADISGCNLERLHARRHKSGIVRLARLNDASLLVFTTEEFLVDCSHHLILPDNGEPELHTKKVNVDSQCLPKPDLNLSGTEQFAHEDVAIKALYYGAGAVAVEAETGWTHAISSPTALGLELPKAVIRQ